MDESSMPAPRCAAVPARAGGTAARLRCRIAALIACSAAMPALAGDPQVVSTLQARPDTVTYSRPADSPPLKTWSALEAFVRNDSTNTLNNVRLEITPNVVDGSVALATFSTSIGATCTVAPPKTVCTIGQLRGGGGAASFVVIYQAPADGSKISYAWSLFYSEGSNDAGAHTDTNTGVTDVQLGTPTATELKTYVPPGGGTFFTGVTGTATPADKWTTTVAVPLSGKAEVVENLDGEPCSLLSADLLDCRQTQVTIPGLVFSESAPLKIILQRDASTIRNGAKIQNSVVYYDDGSTLTPIPLCSLFPGSPSTATVPRCIRSQFEYTRRTAPTPDHVGDWRWEIDALTNGGYRN